MTNLWLRLDQLFMVKVLSVRYQLKQKYLLEWTDMPSLVQSNLDIKTPTGVSKSGLYATVTGLRNQDHAKVAFN